MLPMDGASDCAESARKAYGVPHALMPSLPETAKLKKKMAAKESVRRGGGSIRATPEDFSKGASGSIEERRSIARMQNDRASAT